jgi:hypothetical protein
VKNRSKFALMSILVSMALVGYGCAKEKKSPAKPPAITKQKPGTTPEKQPEKVAKKESLAKKIESKVKAGAGLARELPPVEVVAPAALISFSDGTQMTAMLSSFDRLKERYGPQQVNQVTSKYSGRLVVYKLHITEDFDRAIAVTKLSLQELSDAIQAAKEFQWALLTKTVFSTSDKLVKIRCRYMYLPNGYCDFLTKGPGDDQYFYVTIGDYEVSNMAAALDRFLTRQSNNALPNLGPQQKHIIYEANHWASESVMQAQKATVRIFCDKATDMKEAVCGFAIVSQSLELPTTKLSKAQIDEIPVMKPQKPKGM